MYDHLINTLLYGKDEIKFNDVSKTQYHKKDKQVHRDSFDETLLVIGRSDNRKLKGSRGKSCSKSRGAFRSSKPTIDECSFCRNKGHWKKDCPKLNGKEKKENPKAVVT